MDNLEKFVKEYYNNNYPFRSNSTYMKQEIKPEPKGIIKIVKVLLGWIFGKQPKKPKNDIPKDKGGGHNNTD